MTTNYHDTFIRVADDCPRDAAEVPPDRATKTIARLQYELLVDAPYSYTSDELLFEVHANRNDIPDADREAAREEFFSKGRACLRSSPLTKRYGWGVHNDERGRVALYALGTEDYDQLAADPDLEQLSAMRNRRA